MEFFGWFLEHLEFWFQEHEDYADANTTVEDFKFGVEKTSMCHTCSCRETLPIGYEKCLLCKYDERLDTAKLNELVEEACDSTEERYNIDCDECGTKKQETKTYQTSITTFPRYLLLQVERSRCKPVKDDEGNPILDKNKKAVVTYYTDSTHVSYPRKSLKIFNKYEYKLTGLCHHEHGYDKKKKKEWKHYTCEIKNEHDEWILYDDGSAHLLHLNEDHVKNDCFFSTTAIYFLYEKI